MAKVTKESEQTKNVITDQPVKVGPFMNTVVMMGTVCRNPELRYFKDGRRPMCKFRLCVPNNSYRGQDDLAEYFEAPLFIGVYIFGKSAEVCSEQLQVGRNVFLDGQMKTHYHHTKDGIPILEQPRGHFIHARRIQFLGWGQDNRRTQYREEAK